MTLDVPYLHDTSIEKEAIHLLNSFESKHGTIQTLHTPIEEIIENFLNLDFEIREFEHPSILGQLDIGNNIISVNSTLDPSTNPLQEGRYNFTLAHEVGHNVLHREYAEKILNPPPSLFDEPKTQDTIILCRIDNQKAWIETQADKFASALLMPCHKVIPEFISYTKQEFIEIERFIWGLKQDRGFMNQHFNPFENPDNQKILRYAFKDMATAFHVSMQAMVIRLEVLGLLRDSGQAEMGLG